MFKIQIIQISKTKEEYKNLENEFFKRLQTFAELEIKTLNEGKTDNKEKNILIEGEEILKNLTKDSYVVALDSQGKEFSSLEFAKFTKQEKDFGVGKMTFIIGGPFGLAKKVLETANTKISLSKLTFTHQMVRIILLEQIYRAFTIINNRNYHY
jgi:23S rRNA (pseudouridine1915-N3)-methyltransferase